MIIVFVFIVGVIVASAVSAAVGVYLWDLIQDHLDKEKEEFVPNTEMTIEEVADELGVSLEYARKLVDKLWLPFRYEDGYRPVYKARDINGVKRKLEEMRMKGYWEVL